MIDLVPLGDRALLARFDDEAGARAWAASARRALAGEPGVTDVVLAYTSAAVYADPDRIDLEALHERLRGLLAEPDDAPAGRVVELPVLYDGEDLADVARSCGLSTAEVVTIHSGPIYDVFAVGFLPGFPYAGYLPPELSGLPRRKVPRPRVPAGSVAIAGRQAGVYPIESPGGWHLLGRTPLRIAEPDLGHFPIRAGDRLRFVPINARTFEEVRDKTIFY